MEKSYKAIREWLLEECPADNLTDTSTRVMINAILADNPSEAIETIQHIMHSQMRNNIIRGVKNADHESQTDTFNELDKFFREIISSVYTRLRRALDLPFDKRPKELKNVHNHDLLLCNWTMIFIAVYDDEFAKYMAERIFKLK